MPKFVVVLSDYPCGRGARGRNLQRFLRVFHGRDGVRLLTTDELLRQRTLSTEYLCIGVPTRLGPRHLMGVKYRQAVLFDYQDWEGPAWEDSDREFLLSLTDLYLKHWLEPDGDYGLRMGLLPIRRPRRLTAYLRWLGLSARRAATPDARPYDVSFLGNGTRPMYGEPFHERMAWLHQLYEARDSISFWGGICATPDMLAELAEEFGPLDHLLYPGGRRVGFVRYFNSLLRSRVALAPTGNSRWTYRHYEALLAGATVVTTDLRRARTLIPMPLDKMVHVGQHEPIVPAVQRALEMRRRHPQMAAENIDFLEQFLDYGDYTRRKPALMDLFLDQLGTANSGWPAANPHRRLSLVSR